MIAIEDLVFVVEDMTKPDHPVIGMAVTLPDLNEVVEEYDRLHTGYVPSDHIYGLSDVRRDLGIFRLLRISRQAPGLQVCPRLRPWHDTQEERYRCHAV